MTSSTLKGKVSTRFPARVTGVDPIVVTKTNGDYVITYKPPSAVDPGPGPTVIDNFLELTDTPNSYSGQSAKFVKVNPGETALEFAAVVAGGSSTDFIHPADFGVVANGVADDTVALNNMFAALAGQTGTVLWPPGFCKTTDTITVGSFGSGPGGPQTHINIFGSGTSTTSGIVYTGPLDREVLRFSKCTNFYVSNIDIYRVGSHGANPNFVGISLGGNGSGSGNQTANFVFERVNVINFNIGIAAGYNFGAASEGTFQQCAIAECEIGFVANDFNSLDFNFLMCSFSANSTAIDAGVSGGFVVIGGSASFNGIIFNARSNAVIEIIGFRGEGDNLYLTGAGARVTVRGAFEGNPPSPFVAISGYYSRLVVEDCVFESSITLTGNPTPVMRVARNTLKLWDTVHGLPVFLPAFNFNNLAVSVDFQQNIDSNSPSVPMLDMIGNLGMRDSAIGAKVFYEPNTSRFALDRTGNPSIGVEYLALNHVRQLSEGTMPGATTNVAPKPGQNLRVGGKFNSSATLAIAFKRALTVTATNDPLVTATVGTFLPTDVGKPLKIVGAASGGSADWYGYITDYVSATTVNVYPSSFATPGANYPSGVGKAATVGADEPDASYIIAGLTGNAGETFWVDGTVPFATTGFTVKSSNATSTAAVTALIVR